MAMHAPKDRRTHVQIDVQRRVHAVLGEHAGHAEPEVLHRPHDARVAPARVHARTFVQENACAITLDRQRKLTSGFVAEERHHTFRIRRQAKGSVRVRLDQRLQCGDGAHDRGERLARPDYDGQCH